MSWHKHARLLIAVSAIGPLTGCGSAGEEGIEAPAPGGEVVVGEVGRDEPASEVEVSSLHPRGEYASPEQIDAIFADAAASARAEADSGLDLKAPSEFHRFYDVGVTANEDISTNGQHICIMSGF